MPKNKLKIFNSSTQLRTLISQSVIGKGRWRMVSSNHKNHRVSRIATFRIAISLTSNFTANLRLCKKTKLMLKRLRRGVKTFKGSVKQKKTMWPRPDKGQFRKARMNLREVKKSYRINPIHSRSNRKKVRFQTEKIRLLTKRRNKTCKKSKRSQLVRKNIHRNSCKQHKGFSKFNNTIQGIGMK